MPRLEWIGKDKVINHHQHVPFHVLQHRYGFTAESGKTDAKTDSGNKIIHGDNLAALKSLLPQYEGRVDCIYIDPPYNTGEEKWVYNDNVNDPRIKRWLGEVVGKEGEDLTRDDKWLCMMYPRLCLLKKMLSPYGAIFISIDDNEYENLKSICDEIFGHNCFVSNISWQRTYSPRNDKGGIAVEVEHILVYSRRPGWRPNKLERTEEMDARYSNPDGDFAPWRPDNQCAADAVRHQGMVYAIQHPFTGELLYPYYAAHWRYKQYQMFKIMNGWCEYELKDLHDEARRAEVCGVPEEEVRKGVMAIVLKKSLEESRAKATEVYDKGPWPRFYFTKQGYGGIARKTYLTNVEGRLATNLWLHSEVGHTDEAKKELKEIFDGRCPFDTPKPTRLIKRILDIATDRDSIVLDSFAGSGSTAHAVLQKNQEDHGNRKFILVELMDYADSLTATRVQRAITGYPAKMKHDIVVYNKKLTTRNLSHAQQYLDEANAAMESAKKDFVDVGKPKLMGNSIKVIASRVEDKQVAGIPGAFDYYELGPTLFDDEGFLNDEAGEDAIRQYVYYSETRQSLTRLRSEDNKYLLDTWNGTAYYFYYEPDSPTVLDESAPLNKVEKAEQYIIYADSCFLSEDFMRQHNIIFKKIPRDIRRF